MMKRKTIRNQFIFLMAILLILSTFLCACSSNTDMKDATMEEEIKVEEMVEVVEETIETPQTQTEVQEIAAPVWYMDEEGIKSEELGIMISRDNAEWDEFGFKGRCTVHVDDNRTTNGEFECYYYEGDVDSYIAEHKWEEVEKVTLDNIVFAVKESDESNFNRGVAIVGDGIAFYTHLSDDMELEDIWKNGKDGLDTYEEEKYTDYLAYIEDNVLYIPVLGIKFSGDKEMDTWGRMMGSYVDVYCSDAKYDENDNFAGGEISILNNEYERNEKSAEESIDNYINAYVENRGDSEFEEVLEDELGKNTYIGKGCVSDYGSANWCFATDETPWEINIWYTEECEVDKYLTLIEELK